MKRRLFLAAGAAALAAPSLAHSSPLLAKAVPEFEDLTRYYAFLWGEHCRLAEEMGAEVFCHGTSHRHNDSMTLAAGLLQPASSRALAVLAAAGAGRACLPPLPMPARQPLIIVGQS